MKNYGDVVVFYTYMEQLLGASKREVFRGSLLDAIKYVLRYDGSLINCGRSKVYSFVDDLGLLVPENVIQSIANSQETVYSKRYRYEDVNIATNRYFRQAPVPRTGKRNWRSYYRSPKTFQERKELANAEEYGIKVRGRRKHLPTNYDDIPHSDHGIKCWKRYRKTQYKT